MSALYHIGMIKCPFPECNSGKVSVVHDDERMEDIPGGGAWDFYQAGGTWLTNVWDENCGVCHGTGFILRSRLSEPEINALFEAKAREYAFRVFAYQEYRSNWQRIVRVSIRLAISVWIILVLAIFVPQATEFRPAILFLAILVSSIAYLAEMKDSQCQEVYQRKRQIAFDQSFKGIKQEYIDRMVREASL